MLNGAVQSAGLEQLLDDVLSVESVGIFKPSAKVYDLVVKSWASPQARFCLFHPTDGTRRGLWIRVSNRLGERAGDPMDNLPAKPNFELDDLTLIPDLAAR